MLNSEALSSLDAICTIHGPTECLACKELLGGNQSIILEQLPVVLMTPDPLLYPGHLSMFPFLYSPSTETLIFL